MPNCATEWDITKTPGSYNMTCEMFSLIWMRCREFRALPLPLGPCGPMAGPLGPLGHGQHPLPLGPDGPWALFVKIRYAKARIDFIKIRHAKARIDFLKARIDFDKIRYAKSRIDIFNYDKSNDIILGPVPVDRPCKQDPPM